VRRVKRIFSACHLKLGRQEHRMRAVQFAEARLTLEVDWTQARRAARLTQAASDGWLAEALSKTGDKPCVVASVGQQRRRHNNLRDVALACPEEERWPAGQSDAYRSFGGLTSGFFACKMPHGLLIAAYRSRKDQVHA